MPTLVAGLQAKCTANAHTSRGVLEARKGSEHSDVPLKVCDVFVVLLGGHLDHLVQD